MEFPNSEDNRKNMKLGRLIQIALIVMAVSVMAASANATAITWSTNAGSLFTGAGTIQDGGLQLVSTDGLATLTYDPTGSSNPPTNINLGDFQLTCATCTTEAVGTVDAVFNSFTFQIEVTDTTDGATGIFTGIGIGGTVWSDVSPISITWSPLVLGPGTNNALTNSFGLTTFTIGSPTIIVAPNSGTGGGANAGDTTVSGILGTTATPEPATMAMVGGLFIGLAALARKRRRS
jgi:hypothetical protein